MSRFAVRTACLALAAAALSCLAVNPAKAADNERGTVIRITNRTDKAMSFFVEFRTTSGETRHYLMGTYLKPGETMRYTLGSEWTIPTKRYEGETRYLIRVRGFHGRLESLKWESIQDEKPDHWWGGNSSSFYGLRMEEQEVDGSTHLLGSLTW